MFIELISKSDPVLSTMSALSSLSQCKKQENEPITLGQIGQAWTIKGIGQINRKHSPTSKGDGKLEAKIDKAWVKLRDTTWWLCVCVYIDL